MPTDSHFSVNCFPSPPSLCLTLKLKYPNATDLLQGGTFLKTPASPLASPRRARRVKFGFSVEVGAHARLGGISPHPRHVDSTCRLHVLLRSSSEEKNSKTMHGNYTQEILPQRQKYRNSQAHTEPWTVRSVTSIVAPRQNMGDVLKKKNVRPSHSLLHNSLKNAP